MTAPKHRSSKLRKISYRTPAGRPRVRYRRPRTIAAYCAVCGTRLQGVSTERGLPRSRRRPGRIFAGSLCSACTEAVLKLRARVADRAMDVRDVDLRYRPYVGRIP